MNNYSVDFHVYGYDKNVGELVSAKDAESAIAAIGADIQIDNEKLKTRIAELEHHKSYYQDFLKENTDCESITELVGKYKKQSQYIVELNQQVAFEMRQKAKAREQRDKITKSLEIRDLEQQAKGIEDYAEQENNLKELYHFKDGEDIQHINLITGLNSRAKHLRKQAAKLKEQDNDN